MAENLSCVYRLTILKQIKIKPPKLPGLLITTGYPKLHEEKLLVGYIQPYFAFDFAQGQTRKLCHVTLHSALKKTDRGTISFTAFDPRGRPTVTADSDHCFRTCRPFGRTSVLPSPLFKTKQI